MMDDFMQLKADQLLVRGQRAHAAGDTGTLRACLRELECRTTRAATSAETELRALIRGAGRAKHVTEANLNLNVVKDREIIYRRQSMIHAATKSVWLSSLTFPNPDLVDALLKKAKAGLGVTLIVADRTVRAPHEPEICRLERAGATCVFPDSTHSKALVVDEELVMVGSANADRVHRDLCVVFRDRGMASEVIAYLRNLE
jgi:phosphatidylserine/phosphatidylglycerophosphate/cardiolipin synthase-like enzyme